MDKQRRTHCMASTLARFESSGFLHVGTPKTPFVCSSCWQRVSTSPSHCCCLSDYQQLLRRLWIDAASRNETCRGVHWISWRTFWAIIQMHPFIYNSLIKYFRAHVDMEIFSLFWNLELVPKIWPQFKLHSVCISEGDACFLLVLQATGGQVILSGRHWRSVTQPRERSPSVS
jgi:hypothetical protein